MYKKLNVKTYWNKNELLMSVSGRYEYFLGAYSKTRTDCCVWHEPSLRRFKSTKDCILSIKKSSEITDTTPRWSDNDSLIIRIGDKDFAIANILSTIDDLHYVSIPSIDNSTRTFVLDTLEKAKSVIEKEFDLIGGCENVGQEHTSRRRLRARAGRSKIIV